MASLASSTTDFNMLSPDDNTTLYFASSAHEQALQALQEGLASNSGDLILSGVSGSGKTLLLHKLMQEPMVRFRYLYCPAAELDFDQLLGFICDHLKLPLGEPSRAARLKILGQYLRTSSTTLVLLLDDADKLQQGVIGHLLMLQQSLRQHRSLRLLLCGRESLLTRYERQRKQHPLSPAKAFCVPLTAIDSSEIAAYLQCYAGTEFDINAVDRDTLTYIEQYTKGNPASLNKLLEKIQLSGSDFSELSAEKIDTIVNQQQTAERNIDNNTDNNINITEGITASVTENVADVLSVATHNDVTQATRQIDIAKTTTYPKLWPTIAITLSLVLVFATGLVIALLAGNNSTVNDNIADITPAELTPQVAPATAALLPQAGPLDNSPIPDQSLPVTSDLITSELVTSEPVTSDPIAATVISSQNDKPDTLIAELQIWKRIKDSKDAQAYELYLQSYPTGTFAAIAQQRMAQYAYPTAPGYVTTEISTPEIASLLHKAEQAFAVKALTSPQEDNAVRWLEAILTIDPQNVAAQVMLANVIDTYIDWTLQNVEKGRNNAAKTYLQRGNSLSQYASEQQLLAMNALHNELKSSPRKTNKRRRTVARSNRRNTTNNNSFSAWLKKVDTRMQRAGRAIDRRLGVHNRRSNSNAVEQGFSSR